MTKIKSCECNRLLALNNANILKRLNFKILKLASFCKNFSFLGQNLTSLTHMFYCVKIILNTYLHKMK